MTSRITCRTLAAGLTASSLLTGWSQSAWAQSAPLTPAGNAPAAAPAAPSGNAATPAAPVPADTAVAPLGADVAPANAGTVAVSPTAPATPDPAAASAAAATDTEVAALEQEVTESTPSDSDIKLDLYGFSDFTYAFGFNDFSGAYNSFAVGNLNVYLASNLGDSWRSLVEVRFSYLPHGATQLDTATGALTRTDTTVGDYTDIFRPTRWGGIMIQRAYLEYLAHPLFNIRGGQFLTPYGIWNVDHGSPVIIGVRKPYPVGEALFPESQTGLQIYGSHHFDPVEVGYHLTLSNGRGPIDTYQDLNHNKAIGGRLFARADTRSAGTLAVGLSAYRGRYTDRTQQFVPDAEGNLTQTSTITLDYSELSLGADVKWELGGLLLQGEAMMNDVVYDRERPADTLVVEGPPGFVPDHRRVGAYGLAGYRFAFGGIMPFFGVEFNNTGLPSTFLHRATAVWGGLNVRPTARVVLKAQYTYAWFPDTPKPFAEGQHYSSLGLQAAWSF